jgi:hypothetical protein
MSSCIHAHCTAVVVGCKVATAMRWSAQGSASESSMPDSEVVEHCVALHELPCSLCSSAASSHDALSRLTKRLCSNHPRHCSAHCVLRSASHPIVGGVEAHEVCSLSSTSI